MRITHLSVLVGCCSLGSQATAQVAWTSHALQAPGPSLLLDWQLVFHEQMGCTILFGGNTSIGWRNDTWSWDGQAWQQHAPATSPPAARYQQVYDAARGVLVAIGEPDPSQVWEYDGTNWAQRTPAQAPPPRHWYGLAYDRARARVVLFGGGTFTPSYFNDTWEWNGTTWTQMASPSAPSVRASAAMAFDPVRQRVLLLGGAVTFGPTTTYSSDQWEWDGVAWSAMPPPSLPQPFPRIVTTHLQRNRVQAWPGGGTHWEWDGASWLPVDSPQFPPSGAFFAAPVHDTLRNRVVLYQGSTAQQVWEWDGTTWANQSPVPKPPRRKHLGMAFHTSTQRVVLFGGVNIFGQPIADTWRWNGANWLQLTPAASPPGRYAMGLVEHTSRGELVLFGGLGASGPSPAGDTWVFDGATWAQRTPATSPSARFGHGLAYDRARDRVVLFGGWMGANGNSGSTFEWDGIDWVQRTLAQSPSPRTWPAMTYDEARQRIVLFGAAGHGDTWEYDGVTWTQRFPALSPPAGAQMLVYDRARARAVLFGLTSSTWEWDGTNWTPRTTAATPVSRQDSGFAYDDLRARMVLFGGYSSNSGTLDDTWEYGPTSPASWVSFGSGCPGSAGTPTMAPATPSSLAWLGSTLLLRVNAVPPGQLAFVFFGSSTQWGAITLPTPLAAYGMPGCTLFVAGEAMLTAPGIAGIVNVPLPIPLTPTLLGANLSTQAIVSDPAANATGLIVSNAGTVTIGGR
jgi:hypothetical protein